VHSYINLPLGGLVLVGIIFFFHPTAPPNPAIANLTRKQKIEKLDRFGTPVFVVCMVCLFIALQWGGVKYGWFSGQIVLLMFFFAISGVVWLYLQYIGGENATLPGRIMKMRSISAGAFTSFCMGGAFFILLYYVSIYFQAVKGRSAVSSGLSSLPMILGLTIGMTIAGQTQQYVNYFICCSGLNWCRAVLNLVGKCIPRRVDWIPGPLWSWPGPWMATTFLYRPNIPGEQRSPCRDDTDVGLQASRWGNVLVCRFKRVHTASTEEPQQYPRPRCAGHH